MKEKKNQKFVRERGERELAKTIIKQVQDSTKELDQEVEDVIRLGRFSGGRKKTNESENEIAGGSGADYDKKRETG
ncbi:hypothetical protein E2C01_057468 [Portunus trituberculatus]|uniref:Uncharacterized protein n=1 Tax=Portunus trituberculatus TaxID=210409 RepID=A0A5B7GSY7_PORTR|nr:hypothetical protein [Portunus trituberculatus]